MRLLPVALPQTHAHPFDSCSECSLGTTLPWELLQKERASETPELSSIATGTSQSGKAKQAQEEPACLREEQGYNAKGKGYHSHQLLKTQLPLPSKPWFAAAEPQVQIPSHQTMHKNAMLIILLFRKKSV